MEELTLRECPFCGSPDAELRVSITDAMVVCNNCGARTGLVYLGADEASNAYREREVAAAWNTRPQSITVTEEMIGLLRVLEWGDEDNPGCPFCGMGKETGHLERCQLDAALSKVSPLG